MIALLATLDWDHIIGGGMCAAAAGWAAVEFFLAARDEPWDEEPW